MKAPNHWSCVPTAFAMATGLPLHTLLPYFPKTTPEKGYCLEDGVAALLSLRAPVAVGHLYCDYRGERQYHHVLRELLTRKASRMVLGLSSKIEGVRDHAVAYEEDDGQYIRCPEDGEVHAFDKYMEKWTIISFAFID